MKSFLVVAALAVVIVGIGNWMNSQNADQQALIAAGKAKTPVATTTQTGASTNNALYNQLVQQYRTARIQFGATCQATPTMASYKNGTSIMLDNHTNVAHTVSVGGTSYSLPTYGHQIITLTSATVPGTMTVNCDKSVNVATIRLSQ